LVISPQWPLFALSVMRVFVATRVRRLLARHLSNSNNKPLLFGSLRVVGGVFDPCSMVQGALLGLLLLFHVLGSRGTAQLAAGHTLPPEVFLLPRRTVFRMWIWIYILYFM